MLPLRHENWKEMVYNLKKKTSDGEEQAKEASYFAFTSSGNDR